MRNRLTKTQPNSIPHNIKIVFIDLEFDFIGFLSFTTIPTQ